LWPCRFRSVINTLFSPWGSDVWALQRGLGTQRDRGKRRPGHYKARPRKRDARGQSVPVSTRTGMSFRVCVFGFTMKLCRLFRHRISFVCPFFGLVFDFKCEPGNTCANRIPSSVGQKRTEHRFFCEKPIFCIRRIPSFYVSWKTNQLLCTSPALLTNTDTHCCRGHLGIALKLTASWQSEESSVALAAALNRGGRGTLTEAELDRMGSR